MESRIDQILSFLDDSSVSFTKDVAVRRRFAQITENEIIVKLEEGGIQLTLEQQAGLIFKLAAHCSKNGWQRPDTINGLNDIAPTLVDALTERPESLLDRSSLTGILEAHRNRSLQQVERLRRELLKSDTAEPEVVFQIEGTKYSLVELKTPRHLKQLSVDLPGNCAGVTFNDAALKDKGLTKDDPEAEQYLHYAIKIREKRSRIFVLRDDQNMLIGIDFDITSNSIIQIQGENHKKATGFEVYFPALCEALFRLTTHLNVIKIANLPDRPGHVPHDKADVRFKKRMGWYKEDPEENVKYILDRHGDFLRFDECEISDILVGTVVVNDDFDDATIDRVAQVPRLVVDVTLLSDLTRLPKGVRATITSYAESFHATQLEVAENLEIEEAKFVSIPKLRSAGNIEFVRANSFLAPELRKAAIIQASFATKADAPLLETAGNIDFDSSYTINVPKLRRAGNFNANPSDLIFPELERVGSIRTYGKKLYIPKLKSVLPIFAPNVTEFIAPELRAAHSIDVHYTEIFKAPLLATAGHIDAYTACDFQAPKLIRAGKIDAHEAFWVTIPELQSAGDLLLQQVVHLSAPNLEETPSIYALEARTVDLASLRAASVLYFPKAVTATMSELTQIKDHIGLQSVSEFRAPKLTRASKLYLQSADLIDLPALETIDDIYAEKLENINAPKLEPESLIAIAHLMPRRHSRLPKIAEAIRKIL